MESKACHAFSVVGGGTALHIFSKLHFEFFVQLALIQDPAQINKFEFPAIVLRRRLCLVRVRLHAHERACLWPQSRGSHKLDS